MSPGAIDDDTGTRDFSRVPSAVRPTLRPASSSYGASAAWLFLALLVSYIALTRSHFVTTDEIAVYQQAQSLWERGDLAIDPATIDSVPGRGGRSYARYGIGQSILVFPLYGIGSAVHCHRNQEGQALRRQSRRTPGPLPYIPEKVKRQRWQQCGR